MSTDFDPIHDALRRGDPTAFDQVFRQYFGPLTFFAQHYLHDLPLSEDIVQDCFVTLWNRRKRIGEIQSLKPYLYQCVYHAVLAHLKKAGRSLPSVADNTTNLDIPLIGAEILQALQAAIATLPTRMQQVIRLYYFEEKSYQEIGRLLQIDPETVRSHRFRGIRLLQQMGLSPDDFFYS